MIHTLLRTFLVLCLGACSLRPAEGRFHADQRVGSYTDGEVSVSIQDGLADVSRTAAGIHLWMSAPAIVFEVTSLRTQTVVLEVDNAIPGTRLEPGSVLGVQRDRPTRLAFDLALEAGTATLYRLEAPEEQPTSAWRFAAIGDIQERIDDLPDFWPLLRGEPRLRFVVVPGDLTSGGTAAELRHFKEVIAELGLPFYVTLGNHEVESDDFSHEFGRGSFNFTYLGVAFTFLDLASSTLDPSVEPWLDTWLAAGVGQPHVVVGHVSPLDPVATRNAAFSSRMEAHRFLARLAQGRVDLAIYGHIHSYYAFTHAGIPARITGGGGARPDTLDGIGRHYLLVEVDASADPVLSTSIRRVDVRVDGRIDGPLP